MTFSNNIQYKKFFANYGHAFDYIVPQGEWSLDKNLKKYRKRR